MPKRAYRLKDRYELPPQSTRAGVFLFWCAVTILGIVFLVGAVLR
jgi:hypothetical protein